MCGALAFCVRCTGGRLFPRSDTLTFTVLFGAVDEGTDGFIRSLFVRGLGANGSRPQLPRCYKQQREKRADRMRGARS